MPTILRRVEPDLCETLRTAAFLFMVAEGSLRQRHLEGRLSGILNGVGREDSEPGTDLPKAGAALHARYTPKRRRKTNVSYKLRWG